mmetsp:Transcript_56033/g.177548  ORF Transcript_56033/g.177548 Transcript_56033/m.177548 type:complete len:218 (+) Transcript_56033:466-1119(+)
MGRHNRLQPQHPVPGHRGEPHLPGPTNRITAACPGCPCRHRPRRRRRSPLPRAPRATPHVCGHPCPAGRGAPRGEGGPGCGRMVGCAGTALRVLLRHLCLSEPLPQRPHCSAQERAPCPDCRPCRGRARPAASRGGSPAGQGTRRGRRGSPPLPPRRICEARGRALRGVAQAAAAASRARGKGRRPPRFHAQPARHRGRQPRGGCGRALRARPGLRA